MVEERVLIVNADDFGQSPGVNAGIIAAHENGVVTSTSLMVCWPAARAAADYARAHPALSVGLHFDLGEWAYQQETWVPVYPSVPRTDVEAVRTELARQLDLFGELLGRPPTHLDSHQHVHREEPVRALAVEFAASLGVPLRHLTPAVRYCGEFYGQTAKGLPFHEGITVEHLLRVLAALPTGWTELGCHPATVADVASMYRDERVQELTTLCHPRIRSAVQAEGIRLSSYHDLGAPPTSA
jgi:predicted glycoside hydrolase/deacetylase ChbG (UPF0249 family)